MLALHPRDSLVIRPEKDKKKKRGGTWRRRRGGEKGEGRGGES